MFSDHSTTDYTDITGAVERVVLNAFAKRIAPRAPNLRPQRSNAIVFATSAQGYRAPREKPIHPKTEAPGGFLLPALVFSGG
jgi:hypothetical protein